MGNHPVERREPAAITGDDAGLVQWQSPGRGHAATLRGARVHQASARRFDARGTVWKAKGREDGMPWGDGRCGEFDPLFFFFLFSLRFVFCREGGGVSWVASEVRWAEHKSCAEDEEWLFLADAKPLHASTNAS